MMSLGHQDKPEYCDSCSFKTDELTKANAYGRIPGAGPETLEAKNALAWICDVCRKTSAGTAYLYPDLHGMDVRLTLRTVAWGINTILTAVKER